MNNVGQQEMTHFKMGDNSTTYKSVQDLCLLVYAAEERGREECHTLAGNFSQKPILLSFMHVSEKHTCRKGEKVPRIADITSAGVRSDFIDVTISDVRIYVTFSDVRVYT